MCKDCYKLGIITDWVVLGNLGSWFSVGNLILTQLDEIWKLPSILFSHIEDLNFVDELWKFFLKMEDVKIFSNGRQPQFCSSQPWKLKKKKWSNAITQSIVEAPLRADMQKQPRSLAVLAKNFRKFVEICRS
jgi:hypothetical protein